QPRPDPAGGLGERDRAGIRVHARMGEDLPASRLLGGPGIAQDRARRLGVGAHRTGHDRRAAIEHREKAFLWLKRLRQRLAPGPGAAVLAAAEYMTGPAGLR